MASVASTVNQSSARETSSQVADETKLAIDGGPKAFTERTGKPGMKIGVQEFFSIAERFGFTPEAMQRLRAAVRDEDLVEGGPNLAKYACPKPQPTKGSQFEELAREKFGVKHALGVSSGTGALHAAMVAVGVAPGKEVICPAVGFFATSGAVALAGGTPVFCDVDRSLQIDPAKIESLITDRTVAIAPTHFGGTVCDMDPILAIARQRGLRVVEDCAQSPGAKYRGRYVGSMGDIGCFSISAYKIIGGGEGGMVITSDDRLFDRVNQLAEAGGLWRLSQRFAAPRYAGELFVGTNYRMSELEAAIDLIQLRRLDTIVREFHDTKMRIARQLKTYREIAPQRFNDVDGEVGYHLRFFPETRELCTKIAAALNAEGVRCWTYAQRSSPDWHLYCDMFPLSDSNGDGVARPHPTHARGVCPVADDLFDRHVDVPIDGSCSTEDCDAIAAGINKVLSAYCTPDTSAQAWLE